MARRGGHTRRQIQEIALKLFTREGYNATSLREIAEQLGVTKAALYYHFKSKEEIVESILGDIHVALDDLIDWAAAQPRTVESRKEILLRLAELLNGRWRPLILFAQANQTQLQKMKRGQGSVEQMQKLFSLFQEPDADPVANFRSILAVVALMLANAPVPFQGNLGENPSAVALEVAIDLISH